MIERPGARRKGGSDPYKLGGLSSAEYKKGLRKFLGEDARKMRKETTTNAWELVLDNLPVGKEKEEKKGAPQEGKGAEGAGESDHDRCVESLWSQKKTRQGDSEEK